MEDSKTSKHMRALGVFSKRNASSRILKAKLDAKAVCLPVN